MLTQGRLKEVLEYCPESGVFRWRVRASIRVRVGDVAGCIDNVHGYVQISVDRKLYRANRLAWLYMTGAWPAALVDHKDLDRSNNRWSNLREATKAQNGANREKQANNTSGYKNLQRNTNGWQVVVTKHGKRHRFGTYPTLEEAAAVARRARIEIHGEFANHGDSPR
jgi:hypothetical protein